MKQYELNNWPKDIEPLIGMLLFAQVWDEMLFDFTLDSCKPRRFNVLGLASELIDTYKSYEIEVLSMKSITPIVEELRANLTGDKTAKRILGAKLNGLQCELEQ